MSRQFKLLRRVTKKECPWLDRSFKKGEVVHEFTGHTYGCIGAGIACSLDGNNPFFELPINALVAVSSHQREAET